MAKSTSKLLQEQFSESYSKYFEEEAFFIIGVSGGPDSMALLYLLHKLKIEGLVVHVNYGKRGKQSDKDQELVEQMAFQWKFECCTIQLNNTEAIEGNFQNWAREQRYQFFRDLKDEYKANGIVTAHHQNDQIETILQKLFRGSSPVAWQGMQEWDGELFRPLLSLSKKQILDYCEAESIPYRIDKSNESSDFARNFIRHELSSKMDSLFPGWEKNILALQEHGKTFEASINILSSQVISDNILNLKKFSGFPSILKPAIMKTILDQCGMEGEYSKGHLKELAEIESLQTGKNLRIGRLLLTRDRNEIYIHSDIKKQPVLKEITLKEVQKVWQWENVKIETKDKLGENPGLWLDASKLDWPLMLRNWDAGDSIIPFGMSGTQKISDHLTNRKIPAISREKALVLCGSDGTIYAIIYPAQASNGEWGAISELAKSTQTTQTFLTINIS